MAILSLALAACLSALEWRCTRRNIGTPYNGYGALEAPLWRAGQAPMSTRVLLPLLVGWMPEPARLVAYIVAKMALLWTALGTYGVMLGPAPMAMLAVLIATTFEFDYWDGYGELVGLLLCLTGRPGLIIVGATVWAMSRETVLMAPLLAWPWGLIGPVVWAAILLWQGFPALYCERWMLPTNARDVRAAWRRLDAGVALSLLATIASPIMALSPAAMPPPLGRAAWAPLAWIVAGWTMGRARETRIFMPVALWLAAWGG